MSQESDHKPGAMDISQHLRGYAGFLSASKYGLVFVLGIMVFLAIFRTHN